MSPLRALKSFRIVASQHAVGALITLFFVAGCAYVAGSLWPRQYVGVSVLGLAPGVAPGHEQEAIDSLLRQLPSESDLTAIVTKYQLYPQAMQASGVTQADEYLLSRVSLNEIPSGDQNGIQVQLRYKSSDRNQAQEITEALTNAFVKPVSGSASAVAAASQGSAAPTADSVPADSQPSEQLSSPSMAADNSARIAAIQRKIDSAEKLQARMQAAQEQNEETLSNLKLQQEKLKAQAASESLPKPVTPASNPEVQRLQAQLTDATKKLAALKDRYTDKFPDVIAQEELVQDIQAKLGRALEAAAASSSPAPEKPATSTASALAEIESQQAKARLAGARIEADLEANRMVIARLTDQLNNTKSAAPPVAPPHFSSLGKLTITKHVESSPVPVATPSASASFVVVQPAAVNVSPVFLDPRFLLPVSLVLGIFAALFAVIVAEWHDPSIKSEGVLRREIPSSAVYLGGVPRIRHEVIVQ